MKKLVCLVAVGLAKELSINGLNIFIFVALSVRTVLVVLIKSCSSETLEVCEVAYCS